MTLHQGDQYVIPIESKNATTVITPDDVDDVRIQIGDELRQYSDGGLTFDAENKKWLFHITEEKTRTFTASVNMQVGILVGTDIIYSSVQKIKLERSIIRKDWVE